MRRDDPYRYLPCALHPALAIPHSSPGRHEVWEPQPDVIMGQRMHRIHPHIDLATAPGWDHAVRALVGMHGVVIPESASIWFDATGLMYAVSGTTPEQRREALCRCICAALNLDVDGVFPVEQA